MIKTSWKKSLVIAGVLTALCASAAFAAEQADTKPSMRERVGTILHHDEGDNYPGRPYHMERGRHWGGPMHPGPQLTDEQVKEREARRAEWEKMTPEERQKAHEEKYSKWREERMKNMTPEEKERFEQREKQREEWRKMTPEERQKAREEARAKWDRHSAECCRRLHRIWSMCRMRVSRRKPNARIKCLCSAFRRQILLRSALRSKST